MPDSHPTLPTVVVAFLASPSAPGQGSWVRAQVTSYADGTPDATDTLYCTLLLNTWELTVCIDGSHAELFSQGARTTIALGGHWQVALRDLRVLLADPRLDLLLALPASPTL